MPRRKVSLFYNPDMAAHTSPFPHIEKSTRTSSAYEHLSEVGLIERCAVLPGHVAPDSELLTVHTERHVAEIKAMSQRSGTDPSNRTLREPDGPGGIYYSPEADASARLACGCVVDAALSVVKRAASAQAPTPSSPKPAHDHVAFALVRPPGHHAGADDTPGHRAEGFCFYNSVAVAAGCVLKAGGAKKICILDWDVHHGNGTQKLFYRDGRVLYISLHRFGDHWYPESGERTDVGEGPGQGTNVNVPWPENGLGDTDYLAAFRLVILPILTSFSPDLLLISAGFDAADGDAQGRMRITPAGFAAMTSLLISSISCPVAAALEGGYNPHVTSECCEAVLRVLLGERTAPPTPQLLSKCCEPTLRAVIETQQKYWPVLRGREALLDKFFAEAAQKGQAIRISKRERSAPSRAGDADDMECEVLSRRGKALKSAGAGGGKGGGSRAGSSAASEPENKEAKPKRSHHKASAPNGKANGKPAAATSSSGSSSSMAAALSQLAATVLGGAKQKPDAPKKSHKAKGPKPKPPPAQKNLKPRGLTTWPEDAQPRAGARCLAQWGKEPNGLWFPGTITRVHQSHKRGHGGPNGMRCDVLYDDGDEERGKKVARVLPPNEPEGEHASKHALEGGAEQAAGGDAGDEGGGGGGDDDDDE